MAGTFNPEAPKLIVFIYVEGLDTPPSRAIIHGIKPRIQSRDPDHGASGDRMFLLW